jgi:hypothetical protein
VSTDRTSLDSTVFGKEGVTATQATNMQTAGRFSKTPILYFAYIE